MVLSKRQKGDIISGFVLGFLFLFTALFHYGKKFEFTYELTFLSNATAGLLLVIGSITKWRKNPLPEVLYLSLTVLLSFVFIICIAFISEFNFSGSLFFLHVINPLLLLAYFFFYVDLRSSNKKILFIVPLILPVVYLIFALIFGKLTGQHIYFFLDYPQKGVSYTVLFILCCSIFLVLFIQLLIVANKKIQEKIQRGNDSINRK